MSDANILKVSDYQQMRGSLEPKSRLIAVGGGKGGVGKSFVSTNIAIFLANMGFDTIIVDLDLGAANVHTCLGEPTPPVGLSEFLKDTQRSFQDVAVPTKFRNLRLVSGANDNLDMADLGDAQRTRIIQGIFHTEADFIVLDLSAGTHAGTLDFFLMADTHVVALTPEPSSIENAYRFMKAAFFRRMKRFELQLNLRANIEEIMNQHATLGVKSPADLLRRLRETDPTHGQRLMELMGGLEFNIVLNQSRTSKDTDLGRSIPSVCHKYFGVPAHFLGALDYDNAVWQSLRKRRPLLLEYPQSRLYAQLMAMTRDLAHAQKKKAVV